jgi:uncharacterized membrane protein (Fun14 family)
MRPTDVLRFAAGSATGYPLRTFLMVLAMSIGVAAVVMLTDRKSTRLNSSHNSESRMPSSA